MAKKSMVKTFDFTGVESYKQVPEGRYTAKIKEVEEKVFSSGNDGFVVQFEVLSGLGKGGVVFENYPILDTSLWKIKALLEAIGIDASKKIKLDLMKLIGKKLIIEVILEENGDKTYSRINKLYPLVDGAAEFVDDGEDDEDTEEDSDDTEDDVEETEDEELDDEEDEEEVKPAKKTKKSTKKKKPEPKEVDDDEDDWEDDDE